MHRGAQWLRENAQARLALFDFAFEHAPVGIVFHDVAGRIRRANQAFSRLVGIPLDTLQGMSFKKFAHPDDSTGTRRSSMLSLRVHAMATPSRSGISITRRYRSCGDPSDSNAGCGGNIVQLLSQVQDISAQKESERQLAEKAAQLELAMEAVRGGFWHMDVAAGRFETSERLAQFIGGPGAGRLDLELYLARVNPSDMASADLTPLAFGRSRSLLCRVSAQHRVRREMDALRPSSPSQPGWNAAPDRRVRYRFHRRAYASQGIRASLETDALTGLLNRRGLAMRYPLLPSSSGWTVLLMDLDGFKTVNDVHGHSAGDKVLLERQPDVWSRTSAPKTWSVERAATSS